ncbi:MAG: ribonuclease P protein component [Gammaproteobacteria bacterium]|nr:ribonuclease P protein component [Gammaproteobacteria bacterium]NIM74402.1 ribonuclease P protein component [Gammaproteobacteria bacterium]NIO26173.1 ribonuclease P protein component [Gammaproteobacteria bacterium]NIO66787.1 ribonuclease P protein component [Gammaproteobacteria bacterium]NIP45515.1 ribonuclease P protein component [Gammaproteobacteria bacterium]
MEPRSRFRFQRHSRLRTASDFERVFRRAQKSSGEALTVLARRSGRRSARLGLAIPRRQIRRAVERNRVKRLIRESFRYHQVLLRGLDVVVIGRGALAHKDSEGILRCLERHWQQVSARCSDTRSSGNDRD